MLVRMRRAPNDLGRSRRTLEHERDIDTTARLSHVCRLGQSIACEFAATAAEPAGGEFQRNRAVRLETEHEALWWGGSHRERDGETHPRQKPPKRRAHAATDDRKVANREASTILRRIVRWTTRLDLDNSFERFRKEGRLKSVADLWDAVHDGAVRRIRPKAMTAAAAFIGLVPILWADGTGPMELGRWNRGRHDASHCGADDRRSPDQLLVGARSLSGRLLPREEVAASRRVRGGVTMSQWARALLRDRQHSCRRKVEPAQRPRQSPIRGRRRD